MPVPPKKKWKTPQFEKIPEDDLYNEDENTTSNTNMKPKDEENTEVVAVPSAYKYSKKSDSHSPDVPDKPVTTSIEQTGRKTTDSCDKSMAYINEENSEMVAVPSEYKKSEESNSQSPGVPHKPVTPSIERAGRKEQKNTDSCDKSMAFINEENAEIVAAPSEYENREESDTYSPRVFVCFTKTRASSVSDTRLKTVLCEKPSDSKLNMSSSTECPKCSCHLPNTRVCTLHIVLFSLILL